MALTPQSNILVSDIISEANQNPAFASLSDDKKLQVILAAQGQTSSDCLRNNYKYDSDTVVAQGLPAGGGSGSLNVRSGAFVAAPQGSQVFFILNGVPTPIQGDYTLACYDSTGQPMAFSNLTPNGFIVYGTEIVGVPGRYVAIPTT